MNPIEPKDIIVVCTIFLIFGLALLIPSIVRTYRDRHRDIDEMLDEVLGEEFHVTH